LGFDRRKNKYLMEIIITGASGFVGQNLSNFLSDNHQIEPISIRYPFNDKLKLTGDAVIHLAGKAHDLKNAPNEKEYFEANFELTRAIFDSFLESNCKDFIYFSSVKAVADRNNGILYEDILADPKTYYGQSKVKAEEYIQSKEIPHGRRVIIVRPCMIHGPGNKGNLNLLYDVIKKGIPYPLAAFDNQRSFLSIDNLNYLVKRILEDKSISSGIYNFADDEFLSTNELVGIISSVLKVNEKKVAIPKTVVNLIAKIGDLTRLPFNSENVQKLTENYKVSNQKIKTTLGIEKLPCTAKEGLEKTIKSFINK
jgi:nucleoside-diphosphate-sugar epimerase